MNWVLIVATVGSIALVGAPVRAQVVTREMPMPPLGESLPPAAAAAATTATATASTPATAAVDDFTEAREQYRAAASNHDAATLVDLFAEDGVLVASDHDVIRGRQDIGKYLANAGDQGMPEVTLTCISAESRNGFGSETGRFEERVTSSEGAVTRVTGVYVMIYRRDEAGRWRVAIEIRSRAINSRSDSGSSVRRRAAGGGYFCAAGVATVSVAALSAFAWRPVIETLPQKKAPS